MDFVADVRREVRDVGKRNSRESFRHLVHPGGVDDGIRDVVGRNAGGIRSRNTRIGRVGKLEVAETCGEQALEIVDAGCLGFENFPGVSFQGWEDFRHRLRDKLQERVDWVGKPVVKGKNLV
ncbi:MAG TPA: hypothetical protein VIV61_06075 [Candidatus Ozemobacteraceae bacterium]